MGSPGILRDLDIDDEGGVGRGVVLVSSASAWRRRTTRARSLLRGGTMTGNSDDNDNDNDNKIPCPPHQGPPRYGVGLQGNHPSSRLGVILPPLA